MTRKAKADVVDPATDDGVINRCVCHFVCLCE